MRRALVRICGSGGGCGGGGGGGGFACGGIDLRQRCSLVLNWKPTRARIMSCDCALLSLSRLHMPPPSAATVRLRKPKTSGSERARRSSFCSMVSLRGGPGGGCSGGGGGGDRDDNDGGGGGDDDDDEDDDDDDNDDDDSEDPEVDAIAARAAARTKTRTSRQ